MNKVKHVIHTNNQKTFLPLHSTVTCFLLLKYLDAAGWLWGVCGTIWVVLWAVSIYNITIEKQHDIFETKNK